MNLDQQIRSGTLLARAPWRTDLHLDLANHEALLEDTARRLADTIDGQVAKGLYEYAATSAANLCDLLRALRLIQQRARNLPNEVSHTRAAKALGFL